MSLRPIRETGVITFQLSFDDVVPPSKDTRASMVLDRFPVMTFLSVCKKKKENKNRYINKQKKVQRLPDYMGGRHLLGADFPNQNTTKHESPTGGKLDINVFSTLSAGLHDHSILSSSPTRG